MEEHWILHERARRHRFRGSGTASIKWFPHGSAHYVLDHGERTLDSASYMLLNDGQAYEIEVDAPRPVESFCVFFRPGFAAEVRRDLTAALPALLGDPTHRAPPPDVEFDTAPRRHDEVVSPLLRFLRTTPPGDGWAREECLHRLMEAALRVGGAVADNRNPELGRRLWLAHDYLRSNVEAGPSLRELAAVAALSPNHLIRSYRAMFGRTPGRHLTELRLARARALLIRGRSATEACLAVGFASLGSFSDAYLRRYGVRPSQVGDPGEAAPGTVGYARARGGLPGDRGCRPDRDPGAGHGPGEGVL